MIEDEVAEKEPRALGGNMNIRHHFREIKRLFFSRWDPQGLWRVSARSRRTAHGFCDPERRVIEIAMHHSDPDERDMLFIHEIAHAVADGGHGVKWQGRMEKAAKRADDLGRPRLAQLLREEVAAYHEEEFCGRPAQVYNEIRDALLGNPNLTFPQVKRWLANEYGMLVSEVCKVYRRAEKVFHEAKRDAQESRACREALLRQGEAAH